MAVVALVGRSGAGKTLTLRKLLGMTDPMKGIPLNTTGIPSLVPTIVRHCQPVDWQPAPDKCKSFFTPTCPPDLTFIEYPQESKAASIVCPTVIILVTTNVAQAHDVAMVKDVIEAYADRTPLQALICVITNQWASPQVVSQARVSAQAVQPLTSVMQSPLSCMATMLLAFVMHDVETLAGPRPHLIPIKRAISLAEGVESDREYVAYGLAMLGKRLKLTQTIMRQQHENAVKTAIMQTGDELEATKKRIERFEKASIHFVEQEVLRQQAVQLTLAQMEFKSLL